MAWFSNGTATDLNSLFMASFVFIIVDGWFNSRCGRIARSLIVTCPDSQKPRHERTIGTYARAE